jgi:hypothetical protein
LVGIGWYFLGILPTDTKRNLGYISISTFCGSPFFPEQKGGRCPLFEHSAPLLSKTGFPSDFFHKKSSRETSKKEFSPKLAGIILILAKWPVLGWYATLDLSLLRKMTSSPSLLPPPSSPPPSRMHLQSPLPGSGNTLVQVSKFPSKSYTQIDAGQIP